MKKLINKLKELSKNNKFWVGVLAVLGSILVYFLFFRKSAQTQDSTYEEQYDIYQPATGYTPSYTTETPSSGLSSSDVQSMIDESMKGVTETIRDSYNATTENMKTLTDMFSKGYENLTKQVGTMERIQQASSQDIISGVTSYYDQQQNAKKSRLVKLENILDRIQQNSYEWHTAPPERQKQLESQTKLLRQNAAQEARNQGISYSFSGDTSSAPGEQYLQINVEGYGVY